MSPPDKTISQRNVTAIIDGQKMTPLQYTTILLCFLMNVLDGMDVLVIAFAANSISTEWSISSEALGIVFSAALAGMTVGALLIAPQADRIGRKLLILSCATIMGISIYATSLAQSIPQLILLRFISGLGIGGMLASASTLASEYAPHRSKDFWISLVLGGYPIGAVLTGLVAARLIPHEGWEALFKFAGAATLITIPLIILFLPESLEYLVQKRPRNALRRINRILQKMKVSSFDALPSVKEKNVMGSVKQLVTSPLMPQTLLLWFAFFMAFATLYFLLSWIPKLTTEAGMPEQLGIYSGTIFNLGAFAGILALGGLAIRLGLRKIIFLFMGGAALLMFFFGFFSGSFLILILFGLIGFAMQGGFVGLYAVAARLYPTVIRSTGIGWAIGAGRFGAILGPIIAGYMIGAGLSITTNFIVFAIPCVLAGLSVIAIRSTKVS